MSLAHRLLDQLKLYDLKKYLPAIKNIIVDINVLECQK